MTPHPHSRRDLLLALRGAGGGETAPFVSATESYFCYRAPAIAVTQRGSILVFSEGRVHHQRDEGDIDLVLKRSTDGGRTWSKQVVLENDGANPCKNPAPVVLPNGRVLLLWLWNKSIASEKDRTTREVYVTFSDDDGVTWSKSRNISSSVYGKDWRWYGIGPGHGIVKTRGPHGRIVIPARHNARTTRMISHIIYSGDNGESWKIGGSAPRQMTNESTVVELSNGELMLNSRNGNKGKNECRAVSLSKDGGTTFDRFYVDPALLEPGNGCQGSLLNHSMNAETGKANILFSNPNHGEFRVNGTLKLSSDDGKTWTKSYRYSDPFPKFSGYSDLAVIRNGSIAVVFEKGEHYDKIQRYKEIGFRVIKLSEISTPIGGER
jgi:sialidase-1